MAAHVSLCPFESGAIGHSAMVITWARESAAAERAASSLKIPGL
jgi:hypothetical protein